MSAQFECDAENSLYTSQHEKSTIVSNDCPDSKCKGEITWEDGTSYFGSIENGKMEGEGKITFKDGAAYEGGWKSGKKEGFGAFVFHCGFEYLGNFENDKMHGEGVLRLSETASFSGTWEEGKIQGKGTHFREDGSQFIGEYLEGEPHGQGMVVWESKDTMRGVWKNGLLDEKSQFKFENGTSLIQFWEKGKIQDKAVYKQANGFNVSGSPEQLAKMLLNSSLGNNDSVESNFSLAYYVAAMEYKNQNDFDGATEQLKFAQIFLDPFEETRLSSLLESEIEFVSEEKERTGVAKKIDEGTSSQ
ncbi:MAG: MORN repeat-containing protein [Saprospiraceae bacterium]